MPTRWRCVYLMNTFLFLFILVSRCILLLVQTKVTRTDTSRKGCRKHLFIASSHTIYIHTTIREYYRILFTSLESRNITSHSSRAQGSQKHIQGFSIRHAPSPQPGQRCESTFNKIIYRPLM